KSAMQNIVDTRVTDASVKRIKANEERVNQQVEVLRDPDIFRHTTQQFGEANQATTTVNMTPPTIKNSISEE
ncbi:580_t:CDS:2, partial [Acaulospora morrowiae]